MGEGRAQIGRREMEELEVPEHKTNRGHSKDNLSMGHIDERQLVDFIAISQMSFRYYLECVCVCVCAGKHHRCYKHAGL